tara:strand:+ start:899 stop:1324 length:426 start_codon:yes stop_codon:yes gene_type:complete
MLKIKNCGSQGFVPFISIPFPNNTLGLLDNRVFYLGSTFKNKIKEVYMSIYIIVSMLVISTDDMMTVIELSQLQALELVEKGLQDNGGLIEIFLKDRKDSLIIPILGDDDWKDAKEFITSNLISISNFSSRDVIIQDKELY